MFWITNAKVVEYLVPYTTDSDVEGSEHITKFTKRRESQYNPTVTMGSFELLTETQKEDLLVERYLDFSREFEGMSRFRISVFY